MSDWQPIATAPMATEAGRRPHVLVSNGDYVMVAWWNLAAECWCNTSCNMIVGQPSHWMPLPAPPLPAADRTPGSHLGRGVTSPAPLFPTTAHSGNSQEMR